MRYLELLAPARDLACGLAAIDHGADAVYIGADRFGARAAAGNTIDDIAKLCSHAHSFGAKVYVTVNTIIYDNELAATQKLITDLSRIGVDAILVQDLATLSMCRVAKQKTGYAPALHASTQLDNRTAEKVGWLRGLGFARAVLARELSLEEIGEIHKAVPDIELEVFVHGALCVSYSGQCYASQHLLGRSANRGECAQVCRMKFDLLDADGKAVVRDRYLLSMKDLCQIDHLEELADAGAVSFKIEGRLKGEEYVRNVVSAYSQRLDDIVRRRPNDYRRASWGRVEYGFTPDLRKTFNRGYTNYFLKRTASQPSTPQGLCTMYTPKALGEFVGMVGEVHTGRNPWLSVSRKSQVPFHGKVNGGAAPFFSNGDGLCFIDESHELVGFRVNRVEGNRLFPFHMPHGMKVGMALYRNNDVAFAKTLKADETVRKIPVDMKLSTLQDGFRLELMADTGGCINSVKASADIEFTHQEARTPQTQNIVRQLQRLGDTVYKARDITVGKDVEGLFLPSSTLADLRRKATEALNDVLKKATANSQQSYDNGKMDAGKDYTQPKFWSPEYKRYPYLFNAANHVSHDFYKSRGLDIGQPAFEVKEPKESIVMQCRYCIRYELGYCVRRGGKKPVWKEPLTLRLGDGNKFRLEFRCDECQMNLHVKNV